MSDLTNKTVEELRDQVETSAKIGYPRTAMPAFDELARRLAAAEAEIARMWPAELPVSRTYTCGCVLCICDDDEQCHGCGAKSCGKDDDNCQYKQRAIKKVLSSYEAGENL